MSSEREEVKINGSRRKLLEILAVRFPAAVSPESLGEEINGEGARWAAPVCAKLQQAGMVEKNELGWYRLTKTGFDFLQAEEEE